MKKYGYVIEIRKSYVHDFGYYGKSYSGPLKSAKVFSRAEAYNLRYEGETVRKVELSKNGRPKKIVRR